MLLPLHSYALLPTRPRRSVTCLQGVNRGREANVCYARCLFMFPLCTANGTANMCKNLADLLQNDSYCIQNLMHVC